MSESTITAPQHRRDSSLTSNGRRSSRTTSDSSNSTSSSSVHSRGRSGCKTALATTPTSATASRRNSDSSSTSRSSIRSISSTSSSLRSCAHAQCVLAEPCRRMIEMSGLADTETRPLLVLDNACGGSALATFTIFDMLPSEALEECQIIATDVSQNAVGAATARLSETEWADHVMTLKMDMQNIDGLGEKEFDYVFTNFGINLARDVDSTLKGLRRSLKPDGTCAFTVWKQLEWIDILRKAIKEGIKEAPPFPDQETALLNFSNFHPWHDPMWVRGKLEEHGFASIQIEVLPTIHRFTKDEFIDNFGGCVVAYLVKSAWGQDCANKYKEKIAVALDKYLEARGQDELELQLEALVVTAKKGAQVPSALLPSTPQDPWADV